MTNKKVTIKGATNEELDQLIIRLRKENEAQELVRGLIIKSDKPSYDVYGNRIHEPPTVSTEEPVESLYHYGVLGMKWGVRRTKEQLARARGEKLEDRHRKRDRKRDNRRRRLLSDEELLSKIKRLENEKKLRGLTDEEITPGKKFVKDLMSDSGKRALTTIAAGGVIYAVKMVMTGKMDPAEAAKYMAPYPKK